MISEAKISISLDDPTDVALVIQEMNGVELRIALIKPYTPPEIKTGEIHPWFWLFTYTK